MTRDLIISCGQNATCLSLISPPMELGQIQGKQFAAMLPQADRFYTSKAGQQFCSARANAGMNRTKPANIQVKAMRANWTEESAYRGEFVAALRTSQERTSTWWVRKTTAWRRREKSICGNRGG